MEPLLKLDKVCKKFGGVVAAKDITLDVIAGEVHGLIGPNGAGKTTIMNLISGIFPMDSGAIYLNSDNITNMPSYKRARTGIGRTFQTPRFLQRSSVRDNLYLGTDLHDQISFTKSLFGKKSTDFTGELTELMTYADFDFDWDDDISAIPFGQRKLLEIVRAMLAHPKIILVDEPAAGLTSKEIYKAKSLLNVAARTRNIGVMLIEHQMELVMGICDRIDVLNFGEIIAYGKPKEIASNPVVIEAYLGRDTDA